MSKSTLFDTRSSKRHATFCCFIKINTVGTNADTLHESSYCNQISAAEFFLLHLKFLNIFNFYIFSNYISQYRSAGI